MLRRVGDFGRGGAGIPIRDATFPAPFDSGLEYSSPARGTWNIVNTGMLIPEAHEIFVCAAGCLRGVVLTAAEMDAMDRFSTVAVREHNLLDGDLEPLIIEGVSDILEKLPKLPPAVLVYTSCVHHFTGCDLDYVYAALRERWPQVDFTDCYMNPIMRKSGLTPDQLMRARLYSLLKPRPIDPGAVAIIGNDLPTDPDSDLMRLLRGRRVREITSCRTYAEYQEMAESAYYISYYPAARAGGDILEKRLGGRHLYLPFSFDCDEIEDGFTRLAEALDLPTTPIAPGPWDWPCCSWTLASGCSACIWTSSPGRKRLPSKPSGNGIRSWRCSRRWTRRCASTVPPKKRTSWRSDRRPPISPTPITLSTWWRAAA